MFQVRIELDEKEREIVGSLEKKRHSYTDVLQQTIESSESQASRVNNHAKRAAYGKKMDPTNATEKEIATCIDELLAVEIEHQEAIRRYIERIDFALVENSSAAYSDLDRIAGVWQTDLVREKTDIKKKEAFAKVVFGALSVFYMFYDAIFGVPIGGLLSKLSLLK